MCEIIKKNPQHVSTRMYQGNDPSSGLIITPAVRQLPAFMESWVASRCSKRFCRSFLSWSRPRVLAQKSETTKTQYAEQEYTNTYIHNQVGFCHTPIHTRVSRSTPQTAGDSWGCGGRGTAQIHHFLWEHTISHCSTGYQFRSFLHQTNTNSDAKIIPLRIQSPKSTNNVAKYPIQTATKALVGVPSLATHKDYWMPVVTTSVDQKKHFRRRHNTFVSSHNTLQLSKQPTVKSRAVATLLLEICPEIFTPGAIKDQRLSEIIPLLTSATAVYSKTNKKNQ